MTENVMIVLCFHKIIQHVKVWYYKIIHHQWSTKTEPWVMCSISKQQCRLTFSLEPIMGKMAWSFTGKSVKLITVYFCQTTRMILGMGSANDRQRYNVKLSLTGWTHTQNDPWWERQTASILGNILALLCKVSVYRSVKLSDSRMGGYW